MTRAAWLGHRPIGPRPSLYPPKYRRMRTIRIPQALGLRFDVDKQRGTGGFYNFMPILKYLGCLKYAYLDGDNFVPALVKNIIIIIIIIIITIIIYD